jgi:hypothetical protein
VPAALLGDSGEGERSSSGSEHSSWLRLLLLLCAWQCICSCSALLAGRAAPTLLLLWLLARSTLLPLQLTRSARLLLLLPYLLLQVLPAPLPQGGLAPPPLLLCLLLCVLPPPLVLLRMLLYIFLCLKQTGFTG